LKPKTFMVVAGEASGDLLAAELVGALRQELAEAIPILTADYQPLQTSFEPTFFGAGGPRMAAAGVDLAVDMTAHSVIGLSDVIKHYFKFRQLFHKLQRLALERRPQAIICVDFSGFNRRFAHAIKQYVRARLGWFHDWNPKIIQYVSPQVWASREGRAYQLARDCDLLLSIFPFEKGWYARRVPRLRVEFVGHPLMDRYERVEGRGSREEGKGSSVEGRGEGHVLLLPGSRRGELSRHLPVMLGALAKMRAAVTDLRGRMVLPSEELVGQARGAGVPPELEIQQGDLAQAFAEADVAIASTGTVTMECAYFGVPTVAIYKTSWSTYQIARHIVSVEHLAMPNLLASEEVFPEFIQDAATPDNLAGAALDLLSDQTRRQKIKTKLAQIVASLGGPGASRRGAKAIIGLISGGLTV
jgi:lipid-A-disaccharide synthase